MLTDEKVKELWKQANPFPQWAQWLKDYEDFLLKVRQMSDAELALNEMVGPVLFKLALDRAGESAVDEARVAPSVPPTSTG